MSTHTIGFIQCTNSGENFCSKYDLVLNSEFLNFLIELVWKNLINLFFLFFIFFVVWKAFLFVKDRFGK